MGNRDSIRDSSVSRGHLRTELEKLTDFIINVKDKMRSIENPLAETRASLPRVSEQLDRASAETEAATHRMLDMVEHIISHQDNVNELINDIKELVNSSGDPDKTARDNVIQRLNDLAVASQNSQKNAFRIMDALQFQDITAQQMKQASVFFDEVEEKLHLFIEVFGDSATSPDPLENPDVPQRIGNIKAEVKECRNQREVDNIVSQAAARK